MTKKDEAFALFSKGRRIDAPCVQALGLKTDSVKRYHRLWEEQKVKVIPAVIQEPLAPVSYTHLTLPTILLV